MKPTLPFPAIPPFKPRSFVPPEFDAGNLKHIAPLFDELERQAAECRTAEELRRWVLNWSELTSAVDEEGALRYIAMTCNTESTEAEAGYLEYVEKIEPEVKPRQFRLSQLYVDHPCRDALPRLAFEVFDRDTQVVVELFRPGNVPLEAEDAKLGQQYQKLIGALTVQFQGEEQTLVRLGRYLEEPNRALREEAWTELTNRRLREKEEFEAIFDRMVELRHQVALNAGYANYRDYIFRKLCRFDYTPEDCFHFHQAIEAEVMPLVRQLQATRRLNLGLSTLRPWDIAVDTLNRPALKPFSHVSQLVAGTRAIFDQLDPELGTQFRELERRQLLDLENRKGKGPGGYQWTLAEARVPFIFMNAIGVLRDVETVLHEGGHAFHALACRDQELHWYRNPPIEFCEVASMSMELLGNELLQGFYNEPDSVRARVSHLENILKVLPWVAAIDAFQHWVYTNPGHSRQDRAQAWNAIMDRFEGDVDWSGFEEARAHLWHRQLHLFSNAFYYIEYAIAQLGALQVWRNSREDKAQALAHYKHALALGGSRPLPELFAAAGCPFDFSRKTLAPLMQLLDRELTTQPAPV